MTQNASIPLLEVRDVGFAYAGRRGREVLHDVSLTIQTGESVALQGASGSGKSTLLSLVGLLNAPGTGQILLDGSPVGSLPESERCRLRRSTLGFVFQHHFLLPELSALENVALAGWLPGGEDRGEADEDGEALTRASAILARLGLSDRQHALPRELSGGEQQRVALARAVVNGPRLLLADEPTGNLDSAAGRVVLDMLDGLRREDGLAVLVATHDAEVAARCDRHLHIRDGALSG